MAGRPSIRRSRAVAVVAAGLALLAVPSIASAASSAGPVLAPAPAGTPSVDVVKVTGVIDEPEAAYIRGTIEASEAAGATVILQIDSLGSYGDQAEQLAAFVRSATVPVVAWVGPLGSKAQGGALFLVYSASVVAMAPGAGIGAGTPFDLAVTAANEDPAEVARATAALEVLAPGAGVTPAGVRAVVPRALPAGPAQTAGAVSIVAADIPTLLHQLDGRTVVVGGSTVTLATFSTPTRPVDVRFHEIGPVRRTLHAVGTPVAVYVLLVLGLWAIAFEFTQPGIGLAGIAGVVSLALAGYGLWLVPVRWIGVALILLGVALQCLDVVIKRLAWWTALGTAAFFAGSLVAWWGVAPAIRVPPWLPILFTVGGLLLIGFGFTVALQARERVRSQQVGLVGLTGEARSAIDPEGGVIVKGTVWRARSSNGPIPKGTRVRVRAIDGLVLRVEPEPQPEPEPEPEPGRGAQPDDASGAD